MHAESRGIPRSIEAVAAALGLVAGAPVLGIAAALVKLTSSGPAIFVQERVGLGGRRFPLYKLRTMRHASGGRGFTSRGDPRITSVGRLLRLTKLDELPQLLNVLRGDLSLVGPRPEVARYVNLSDPLWRDVVAIRPGLTHPVTLQLRDEEGLLAGVDGDPESFYEAELIPFKLLGYLDYQKKRTWQADVRTLLQTALAVVLPHLAPRVNAADVIRRSAAIPGAVVSA
jgi:lipopolysaccharide/colanic/teichoic acid biosynthesis glycosyltransferase